MTRSDLHATARSRLLWAREAWARGDKESAHACLESCRRWLQFTQETRVKESAK